MSEWERICRSGGAVLLLGALLFVVSPAAAQSLTGAAQMRISLTIPARAETPAALRVDNGGTQGFDLCLGTSAGYRVQPASTNSGVLVRRDGARQRPGEIGDVRLGACANERAYSLDFADAAPNFSAAHTFVIIPQ